MENTAPTWYHWVGRRVVEHHCESATWNCECDAMPRYKDAAAVATQLGLTLEEPDWTRSPSYTYQHVRLQKYKALLGAVSSAAVLKELQECALTLAQSQRAWEALRLDEAVDARGFGGFLRRGRGVPPKDEDTIRTRVHLLKVADSVEHAKTTTATCFFVSDSADSQDRDAVEKWEMVHELTIGIVYRKMETEVIVAVEKTVVAIITYDEGSRALLRCAGKVGVALELLTAVGRITREISHNSNTYTWVREFEDVASILASSIGVAALSDFKSASSRGKVQPSGASRWMPEEIFDVMLTLLPVREGFVDLRDAAMHSAVRPVSYTHVRLLCPLCWVTGEPNSHGPAVQIQPLRLVGPSDQQHDEYTAVSHLWSEFGGDDTIRSMKKGATMVGGPASLWIDKLCINQEDNDEKATELSHMGSYYAGAHTTLICPARQVTGVPSTQQCRHLVAIPSHLSDYQGLRSWRQDPWHDRVWTFQEAYLSRNPQVVNSETNTGLNACWLDFVAYAAEQDHPIRCEVGLPPFRRQAGDPAAYGALGRYSTPFMRGWAACSYHNWVPDISSIKMPLGKLLDLTHRRKCTEEPDNILGVLGVARSTEKFMPKGISTLDDAYREAVRCGALGVEVLLADLGGASLNSYWVPKDGSKAKHLPCMGEGCNALQPDVDEEGRLICKAYEVDMDIEDRAKYSQWGTDRGLNIRFDNGTSDAHVYFHGCSSTQGRVYMLAAVDETDSLKDRILVWASETGSGTHRIEGTGKIVWGHRYHNSREPGTEKTDRLISLRLG